MPTAGDCKRRHVNSSLLLDFRLIRRCKSRMQDCPVRQRFLIFAVFSFCKVRHSASRVTIRRRESNLARSESCPRSTGTSASCRRKAEPLSGIGRIKRNVGCTCLQYAQQPNYQGEGTFHADAHQGFGPHSQRLEMMCELVGLAIQLCITEELSFIPDRRSIGSPLHLRFDHLVKT